MFPSKIPAELIEFILSAKQEHLVPYKECLTPKQIIRESLIPYLPIEGIEVPIEEMYQEAMSLKSIAVAHRYKGEHCGWSSLSIHGISSQHTEGAEQYGLDPFDQSLYRFTEIADQCPVTKKFLQEKIQYETFQRVRFMYLEPGGYISPHKDAEQYYLGPINIALNNPEGCEFLMEKIGIVPFNKEKIIKLALCNRHAVYNNSNEVRVHMILHGSPRPEIWYPLYEHAYKKWINNKSNYKTL